MDGEQNVAAKPFPAVKVGIAAGVAMAVTLTLIGLTVWAIVWVSREVTLSAATHAELAKDTAASVVRPDYRAKYLAYIDASLAVHAAALQGRKPFNEAKKKADILASELSNESTDRGELFLDLNVSSDKNGFSDCASMFFEFRLQSLAECEKRYPLAQTEAMRSNAGSPK